MIDEGVKYVIEAEISQAMSNFQSLASQLKKLGVEVDDSGTDFQNLSETLKTTRDDTIDAQDGFDILNSKLDEIGNEIKKTKNGLSDCKPFFILKKIKKVI